MDCRRYSIAWLVIAAAAVVVDDGVRMYQMTTGMDSADMLLKKIINIVILYP